MMHLANIRDHLCLTLSHLRTCRPAEKTPEIEKRSEYNNSKKVVANNDRLGQCTVQAFKVLLQRGHFQKALPSQFPHMHAMLMLTVPATSEPQLLWPSDYLKKILQPHICLPPTVFFLVYSISTHLKLRSSSNQSFSFIEIVYRYFWAWPNLVISNDHPGLVTQFYDINTMMISRKKVDSNLIQSPFW